MTKRLDLMLGDTDITLNLSSFTDDEIRTVKKLLDIMDNDIPTTIPFKAEYEDINRWRG